MKAKDKPGSKIQTTIRKFLRSELELESETKEKAGTSKESSHKPIRLGASRRPLLAGSSRPVEEPRGQEGGKGAQAKIQGRYKAHWGFGKVVILWVQWSCRVWW